ncbi:Transcriptional activator protein acu-15 [Paramyrothecium foliicola]|nr:Transcriptional activator protein acu-15 [Paramyrothecium foliicola]
MASTLACSHFNHNYKHNPQYHEPLHDSQHTRLTSPSASGSDTAAPFTPSSTAQHQPLPVVAAGAATAAAAAHKSSLSSSSLLPSLLLSHPLSGSNWVEWPQDQQQQQQHQDQDKDHHHYQQGNRQLGSDPKVSNICVGAASATPTATGSARTTATARSRRPAGPRRHRQRRSSSTRRMYKPPTTASASSPSPSPVRCSGSCASASRRISSPSPGIASATTATATLAAATAPTKLSDAAGTSLSSSCSSSSSSSFSSNTTMSGAASRSGNKRSTDGPTSDDPSSTQTAAAGKLKLPRLDRGPDDFSSVVKNRLQSYTRTGQACDRCKVRKIRCDALPEGCSHCINLNLECYVTDRVTGRTERRGYMQQLEREKSGMLSYIRDLEKRLGDNGVEIKPWQGPATAATQDDNSSVSHHTPSASPTVTDWTQSGPIWMKSKSSASDSPAGLSSFSLRPRLLAARNDSDETLQDDEYGPVALKSIHGTRLTLLDMTMDTTVFQAPEMDEPPADSSMPTVPLWGRSVKAFLQSSFSVNPIAQPSMPSRNDAVTFCDWYFMVFAPYLPLLHKPTFSRMVTRIYDEPGFKPSAAELLMLHIIFAMIYHNYGVRNWQPEGRIHFTELADKHYHFALTKFQEVLHSRELSSVQALGLLAYYTRTFPKPGLSPLIIDLALQKAIDLNLHRRDPPDGNGTNLKKELRKRAWWSILSLSVFAAGRLGRPMPITAEQFDTEFPEAIADEHLSEDGVDSSQTLPCTFVIGIVLHRLTTTVLEIYTHLYSPRCDRQQYPYIVEVLDQRVREWEDALPDILRIEKPQQPETFLHAYYTKMFVLEVRLLLRHPSLVPAGEKELRDENIRITEATSHEMLVLAQEIIKYRAIDATWYHLSLFVSCIFSTLAIHWEQRGDISLARVANLHEEMARWVSVIKEVTVLMGSGPGLAVEVSRVVDRTIAWIERDMGSQDPKSRSSPPDTYSQGPPLVQPGYDHARPNVPVSAGVPSASMNDLKDFYQKNTIAPQESFPAYSYENQTQNSTAVNSYGADHSLFYSTSTQTVEPGIVSIAPNNAPVQANPLAASPFHATQPDMVWQNRGAAWVEWEGTVADGQDRYSASALLTLGATRPVLPTADHSRAGSSMGQTAADIAFIPTSQWPLNLFDSAPRGGNGGAAEDGSMKHCI